MATNPSEPGTSSNSTDHGLQKSEAGQEPDPVVRALPEPPRPHIAREEVAKQLEKAGLFETADLARRTK
jgi:hypothetical protein